MAQAQNQLLINGQVVTNTGEVAPNVKIELRDQAGVFGLIGITYTDKTGKFTFSPFFNASTLIAQKQIQPQYVVYAGSKILFQEIIPYSTQQVKITLDSNAYHTGINEMPPPLVNITGKLTLVTSRAPVTNVRIDLTDASGNYPFLIASTNATATGDFSFALNGPMAEKILSQANNLSYNVFLGNIPLLTKAMLYNPQQVVSLTIPDALYQNSLNKITTPIRAVISGQVLFRGSGQPVPGATIQLADSQISSLGILSVRQTDDSGSFNIQLLDSPSIWVSSGRLMPVYNIYREGVLVASQPVQYTSEPVTFTIDEPVQPPDFDSLVANVTQVRAARAAAFRDLSVERENLKVTQYKFDYALENRLNTIALSDAINVHTVNVRDLRIRFDDAVRAETDTIAHFMSYYDTQQYAVSQLNDRIPVLFFPVRLETLFHGPASSPQLWVRIFPDDIAVDTHEEQLTQNEIDHGAIYWQAYVDAGADLVARHQAWDLLARSFGAERAAWITLQTQPSDLTTLPLVFPALVPKADSWTQQPVTRILPDAFVINCYTTNDFTTPNFSVQTNFIPDEIKMGLDPNNNINFDQVGGDLVTDPGADIDWLIHFDAAIAKGLGAKIPISNTAYESGFTRIIVLGVKTSLSATASQGRLQDLIDSHHYTDGFSLLKQASSTNNTDNAYSGYSSVNFSNTTTHAIERESNLFAPVTSNIAKPDGQVLCEALGIDYNNLYHIYHSNGFDIRDAMNINNALWATSWGYYLTDMMAPLVSSATTDKLRDFFTDFVKSRGALPSVRSGIQPYGILPATMYSRMNWSADPMAGLYSNVHHFTGILDAHFAEFATAIPSAGVSGFTSTATGMRAAASDSSAYAAAADSGTYAAAAAGSSGSQKLLDILGQNAVSQDTVQRIGVGSGYIWNNLAYADRGGDRTQTWLEKQLNAMSMINETTGLPLNPYPKISQVNFMSQHSDMQRPLVADKTVDRNSTLPPIGDSGINYMELIARATFAELRDEHYERFTIQPDQLPDASLYKYVRQSLMLEYFNAACRLLGIPDDQRTEPELVNIVNADKEQPGGTATATAAAAPGGESPFTLYAGASRWSVMAKPFEGYDSVDKFIDASLSTDFPQVVNVVKTRNSVLELSRNSIGQLDLLTREVIDSTSHRLDTWRLALVNQRLNDLRGIRDGSAARNQGIYLGAYGWLENIKRKGTRTVVSPPTANFSGTIYSDTANEGYIHAPSINQAAAAAVLRNGYVTRADSSNSSVLSVNISSERVRSAQSMLEGLRNGQPIAQLLGSEFEQRLRDNYTYAAGEFIDTYITDLRKKFTMTNTVTAYDTSLSIENIKASNVLDGVKLIDAFRTAGSNIATFYSGNPDLLHPPADIVSATAAELQWIMNILDATGDLSTAEGVFQLVQGNQSRASAVTEAVSRGTNIPEIQMTDTPKTGISVYQKLTMHLEPVTALPAGWTGIATSPRSDAEPYLNRWIGQLLGDPALIKCKVTNLATNTDTEVTVANLGIQPIDLVYIVNDELVNDDSELSLRVRRYRRQADGLANTVGLSVNYKEYVSATPGSFSFEEILPLLRYLRTLIAGCRNLRTTDYITATDADGVPNQYDYNDFRTRATAARTALQSARDTLFTVYGAFTDATGIAAVRNALFALGAFGFDQTVYEYQDAISSEVGKLQSYAFSVLTAAQARLDQYDALHIPAMTIPPADQDEFISTCLQGMQALFGRKFNALPLFTLRTQEHDVLYDELTGGATFGTLLNDQASNPFVVDEWFSGIAKIRKNIANYELLSIMASAVNLDSFTANRAMVPLQVPYASDGTERWMGANVNDTANSLKEGRTSFGVSIPGTPASFAAGLSGNLVGLLIDEWIDVIPNRGETTGIAFQFNQPLAKPPQCLLLGLTPVITGHWQWTDMVGMINETFDLAKKRAVTYETLSSSSLGHLGPAFLAPFTTFNTTIGFTASSL